MFFLAFKRTTHIGTHNAQPLVAPQPPLPRGYLGALRALQLQVSLSLSLSLSRASFRSRLVSLKIRFIFFPSNLLITFNFQSQSNLSSSTSSSSLSASASSTAGVRLVDARRAWLQLAVRRSDALHPRAAAVARLYRAYSTWRQVSTLVVGRVVVDLISKDFVK